MPNAKEKSNNETVEDAEVRRGKKETTKNAKRYEKNKNLFASFVVLFQ